MIFSVVLFLCGCALSLLAQAWNSKVSSIVPEPYLDEVFHIPQAQAYCSGNLRQWDPKLTTPPGLYAVNYFFHIFLSWPCDTKYLRSTNVTLWLHIIAFSLFYVLLSKSEASRSRINDAHTALNIFLFPPLFFFFALYYTDVASTALVLLTFAISRARNLTSPKVLDDVRLVLCGSFALTFRQTNIFWVAIFPAGLDVFLVLKAAATIGSPTYRHGIENGLRGVIELSWIGQIIYDPLVAEAGLLDYPIVALSMVAGGISNMRLVARTAAPYTVLLVLFVCFIIWNGGVVLGDKSNHKAMIHLPQMLYIWAYIAFFSFPLLIPNVVGTVTPLKFLPASLQRYKRSHKHLPGPITFVVLLVLALMVIHLNTIFHPFTLADNRHYTFYVFRIFRLYPLLKYIAVPIYLICGWAVIQALAAGADKRSRINVSFSESAEVLSSSSSSSASSPSQKRLLDKSTVQVRQSGSSSAGEGNSTITAVVVENDQSARASFVLLWILTCTLNLATAPLVEPRYFILPWIFWRLHVPPASGIFRDGRNNRSNAPPLNPASTTTEAGSKSSLISSISSSNSSGGIGGTRLSGIDISSSSSTLPPPPPPNPLMVRLRYLFVHVLDPRFLLETVWFLLVNGVTGYIFLYKGFEWVQEPGKVQRFLY